MIDFFVYRWKVHLANSKGFTLIELMVVVAIIGILSSIAIPKYEKYKRKSLQAEAKFAVAAMYAGEKAFYSEYSAYIGALDAIGYVPQGLRRCYAHIINTDLVGGGVVTGYSGGAAVGWYDSVNNPFPRTYTYTLHTCNTMDTAEYGTDSQVFFAYAHGNLGSAYDDLWSINEVKRLSNCAVGL